jgi:hypothetical protein
MFSHFWVELDACKNVVKEQEIYCLNFMCTKKNCIEHFD